MIKLSNKAYPSAAQLDIKFYWISTASFWITT